MEGWKEKDIDMRYTKSAGHVGNSEEEDLVNQFIKLH
jgi:hypothetical protein